MRCPFCGHDEDRVVDSRPSREGDAIRRRRACAACDLRFTTWERVELPDLQVRKRGGEAMPFDRARVLAGMARAAAGRAIDEPVLTGAAAAVEREVRALGRSEVSSDEVGQRVMAQLQAIDTVAYVRFASVYRDFQDAEDFEEVLSALRGTGDLADARARLLDPERDLRPPRTDP